MYHVIPSSVGALGAEQRSSPLPAGSYWVDVFGANRPKMIAWLSTNRGAVQALTTTTVGDDDEDPNTYDEYTFKVTNPVPWDAVTFGYPDIVDAANPAPSPSNPTSPASTASPTSPNKIPAKASISSNTTVLVIGALAVIGLTITVAVLHRRAA